MTASAVYSPCSCLFFQATVLVAATCLALVGTVSTGHSQGTIQFANIVLVGGVRIVDAPVRAVDGSLIMGTGFQAALYAGAAGTAEEELRMIGPSVSFAPTTAGAGYFLGGNRTLNENGVTVLPGDPATLQVRVWALASGPTWETATIRIQSNLLTLDTGSVGLPPGPPAPLIGLAFPVPEPSIIALGLIGALGAFLRLRQSN